VLARILPATVSVELGRAAGSGVIVSHDGLVLTAAHVIGRPGRMAWIELPDGRRFRGRTLGANHDVDAGMIRLEDPPADLPFAPISQGPPLIDGEWVITTGQPGGIVSDRAPPVRLGRVLAQFDDMVCTDCKLVGGDSGGPLFNMRGEVVGVHSSIGPLVTHNFHVPATAFRKSWDRLLASEVWGGRFDDLADEGRPYIGVAGRTENGRCVITQVYAGMPAEKVGVEIGDVVVTVNDRPITSFEQLSNIVAFKSPGEKITLTVQRGEVNMQMSVELVAAEPPDE
jgi:serine protease Do